MYVGRCVGNLEISIFFRGFDLGSLDGFRDLYLIREFDVYLGSGIIVLVYLILEGGKEGRIWYSLVYAGLGL